jgi:uncharacterized membrane protein YfcA
VPSKPSLRLWKSLVGAFLVCWVISVISFGWWPLVREHWGIALVMIGGSLVAGSTPMGGGSVAFPILVYVFGESPENARNFGLAIQALGMSSALLFILGRGTPIQKRLLLCACSGAAAGIVFGTFFVAPYVSRSIVKLLFSCLWMSFAMITLARNKEFCALKVNPALEWNAAARVGLPLGLLGGVIASMIGVGLEMVLYTVLVLLFRCDLKVAVPTAVCATAIASIVGAALHIAIGDIPKAIFGDWLAAAPIVIFGAPAGTFIVTRVPRMKLLYFVSALCVFQFFWTLRATSLNRAEWSFVIALLVVANAGFVLLYRRGKQVPKTAVAAAAT